MATAPAGREWARSGVTAIRRLLSRTMKAHVDVDYAPQFDVLVFGPFVEKRTAMDARIVLGQHGYCAVDHGRYVAVGVDRTTVRKRRPSRRACRATPRPLSSDSALFLRRWAADCRAEYQRACERRHFFRFVDEQLAVA